MYVHFVENNGIGINITLQVLDAIMCHNGELELLKYYPKKKTKEEFLALYHASYQDQSLIKKLVPMTLEGCVVRISDIIAYIGRDIEDATRMGVITLEEIPREITSVLGVTNREIINTIIIDLIENSIGKEYLSLSPSIFSAIKELKKFNYEHIYYKANTEEMLNLYEKMFKSVFDDCLKAIKENNRDKNIFKVFLDDMDATYLKETSDTRKVIDYIAGMTDDFLVSEYNLIN